MTRIDGAKVLMTAAILFYCLGSVDKAIFWAVVALFLTMRQARS